MWLPSGARIDLCQRRLNFDQYPDRVDAYFMNASVTENYPLVLVHTESLILPRVVSVLKSSSGLICITAVSVTLES